MRFGVIVAAATAMLWAGQAEAQYTYTRIAEVEPNNSLATAQFVPLSTTTAFDVAGMTEGNTTDYVDYFRFTTGSLACQSSILQCYGIYLNYDTINVLNPYIQVFDASGTKLFYYGDTIGGYFSAAANQTFTAAVARNPNSPSANYDLFMRMTYSYAPEPATWALMLAGIGTVGYMLRRRRPKVTFA